MWGEPIGWRQHDPKGCFFILLKGWRVEFSSSSQRILIKFVLFLSITHQNRFVLIQVPIKFLSNFYLIGTTMRRTCWQFERRWSRDTKPSRCGCRQAAAWCWLETRNHTTGLTQDQKQIIRFFYAEPSSVKRLHNMLDNLVHIFRNSNMLSFADFERHLQGYDLTLSCHVSFSFCWLVTFKVLLRSFLWFAFVLMHLVLWNPGP